MENLERMRVAINGWLFAVIVLPEAMQTEQMFHFLCSDANTAPSSFEILWPCEKDGDDVYERNFNSNMSLRNIEKQTAASISRTTSYAEDEAAIGAIANVDAEIMFHRSNVEKKDTMISLESFDIIKVIGKGTLYSQCITYIALYYYIQ